MSTHSFFTSSLICFQVLLPTHRRGTVRRNAIYHRLHTGAHSFRLSFDKYFVVFNQSVFCKGMQKVFLPSIFSPDVIRCTYFYPEKRKVGVVVQEVPHGSRSPASRW